MKIVEILEATLGGTARHVIDLCRGMRAAGHEVHLIHNPREGRVDAIFRAGLPLLEREGVVTRAMDMPRAVTPADARIVFAIRRYLQRHGPFDVIHGHSSKAGAYARLAAVGLPGARIYTPNALITTNPELPRVQYHVYSLIERILARLGHAFIAVSEQEHDEALRLGVQARCLFLIPNGTDAPETRVISRKELGLGEADVVIGTVGRLVPQKSTAHLLRAFALLAPRHPQLSVAIVGSGALHQTLEAEATTLGIDSRVHWLGSMDGPTVMPAFDMFALPSVYEGFPYVLIEAMQRGLPIVTTAIGGASVLVDEGRNGFIVPIGRPDLLAASLEKLVVDADLRNAMRKRSLERASQFSARRMVGATLKVYEAAITSR